MNGNENYTGALVVRAATSTGALPIPGATVVVRLYGESGEGPLLAVLRTDADGRTAPLIIETPPPSNSLSPGGEKPYTEVSIEVSAEGYYGIVDSHVPIFPGITSVQPAWMVPLPDTKQYSVYNQESQIVNDERGMPML